MKKLIIVDISSFIFRAFFAIQRSLHAPDGTPVNAVQGVWSMLYKLLSKYQPTHIFIACDTKGDTFRNELYKEYKANRSEPPEELVPQFPLIFEMIDKMGLPKFSNSKYEADDLIGSACEQWKSYFDQILIASSDKDLMQFVDDKVKMLDTMKDKIYDRQAVYEKMGVWPEQIVDYLAIVGDASDNVPGMKGVGAKGAATLLEKYKTFDACVEHRDEFVGKRLKEAFTDYLDKGLLSKKLITIHTDVVLGHTPEETEYKFHAGAGLEVFFKKLNFKNALNKLSDLRAGEHSAQTVPGLNSLEQILLNEPVTSRMNYKLIETSDELAQLKNDLANVQLVACHTVYDSDDILNRRVELLAINYDEQTSFLIERNSHEQFDSFLHELWADSDKMLVTEHAKRDYCTALGCSKPLNAKMFDVVQAHYILNPDGNHHFDSLCSGYADITLDHTQIESQYFQLIRGVGFYQYHADISTCLLKISKVFSSDIKKNNLEEIFYNMDMQVIPILAEMERQGVLIDVDYLKTIETNFSNELLEIEKDVGEEIKCEINLKSPKQVGQLLFEKLGLPIIKRTKTGPSTDSEVLEELDSLNLNMVPGKILRYREIDKLLNTYVKTLPDLRHPVTHRIHTNFSLHTAATGRLSSLNPNLQNIPIRSESGRMVRKAFIPSGNNYFLSADYSQVELRILAHMSQDQVMLKAFRENIDIHVQTASEVMGISIEEVTKEHRRMAKAVNFGLMYGQSSFGLSKVLKISRTDAKVYIENYFNRFQRVKAFLDELKEFAELHGYSKTIHGRKRFLPEIKSSNRAIKSQAERVAINSPIQGTAADIVKVAMISIDQELSRLKLKSKMLLQVHDELIFEGPEEELSILKEVVKDRMENVVSFSVPLVVDIGIGKNWLELK